MLIAYDVSEARRRAAEELFQLFKVPAHVFSTGTRPEVLITDGSRGGVERGAVATYTFASGPAPLDVDLSITTTPMPIVERTITWPGASHEIPVPSGLSTLAGPGEALASCNRGVAALRLPAADGHTFVRFGYNLFDETARLLTAGQPISDVSVPSLDLHIALLRRELCRDVDLTEIPAIPSGHECIVTLSHDIDHMSLREHRFDVHWLSFMRQATLWPPVSLRGGRMSAGDALKAWALAAASPLIILGALPDPWNDVDGYRRIEARFGARSTYFFIPFAYENGVDLDGRPGHMRRWAGYDLAARRETVKSVEASGAEIALHGLDAWSDVAWARRESERLATISGRAPRGIRMHYLYADEGTSARLEEAGFAYDSTVGFSRHVGFRAGTLQPYVPLTCRELLEFPVHLEDGGLLSRSGAWSTPAEARKTIDDLLDNAVRAGGALNASWHDNSLKPPRSWIDPYLYMLNGARERLAWMPTMEDACRWFRLRRGLTFRATTEGATAEASWPQDLPAPLLRTYARRPQAWDTATALEFTDMPLHFDDRRSSEAVR
ncbi:MAG TPA: hypothetical protein VG815_21990 [Chloroflexota bacterium]|jgi:hypothetical protein|nr:hypothetical protein [Chloroflexota bacterium]